jgi:DNA-binding CsgD family transcriptional regulator
MARRQLLDVVEAAYDLDASDEAWGEGLVAAAVGAFPGASGALGFRYRLASGAPQIAAGVLGDPAFLEVPSEGHEQVSTAQVLKAYLAPSHAEPTTLFHADPVTGHVPEGLHRMWARHGLSDMFGIYANRHESESLTLGIAMPRVSYPTVEARDFRGMRRQWSALARHLELALAVRESMREGRVVGELDEHGRGDFDDGAAPHRDVLAESARRLEHARKTSAEGDDRGLSVWEGLLRGRWSIVRHRSHGGRLRFLAIENPPADVLRTLTAIERDVVMRAAVGEANKVIASELGIHVSSAAEILTRAMRKLGIEHRVHLAQLAGVLGARR